MLRLLNGVSHACTMVMMIPDGRILENELSHRL